MLDCQDTLKFNTFIYHFHIVTITVTGEQLTIHDKLYMKDDIIKLPMWLAKRYYQNNHCIIKEFEEIEGTLNDIISNQQMTKQNLVPLEQDFYLMVNDYFNFYVRYKLKYLEFDDTIPDNKRSEKEMEIMTVVKSQRNRFKKLVEMRKKLLLLNSYLGYNRSLTKNMTFEECMVYNNICDVLGKFDDNFGYKV